MNPTTPTGDTTFLDLVATGALNLILTTISSAISLIFNLISTTFSTLLFSLQNSLVSGS